jgi:transposase
MKCVEGLSQREIHRRTGVHRDTIRRALASPEPPRYGPRSKRLSKLDPFLETVEELLYDDPTLSGVRIREELAKLGYEGGKTIVDDLLRELRPRYLRPRTFQRTRYRPAELAQFDLMEPRAEIPVGFGQTRRGYLVTCEPPFSGNQATDTLPPRPRSAGISWSSPRWGAMTIMGRSRSCRRPLGGAPRGRAPAHRDARGNRRRSRGRPPSRLPDGS